MIENTEVQTQQQQHESIGRLMANTEMGSPRRSTSRKVRTPGVAAVLSAILPGLGQVYNGRFLWAILWFVITPGLWIGSGGFLGWVCHILSALQAYGYAKRRMEY